MKKYNFSAGPAAIPQVVLQKAQKQLADYQGFGLSLLELSHRGKVYAEVHNRCISLLKEVLQIPETHQVLLLGGGATLQFAMAPMNLLFGENRKASLALSGAWSLKALDDLQKVRANVELVFDGRKHSFHCLPDEMEIAEDSCYLHICSNETINGVQWHQFPKVACPIVADMSSDIASRSLDWHSFGLAYAGAQKNLGPAGVCVVVITKDLLARCNPDLPAYLSYAVHAKNDSLYNTPPSFAVYMMMLQLEWILEQGGLAGIQAQNHAKAAKLYTAIDSSKGFYVNHVEQRFRSEMNVPFRLADESLEEKFLKLAAKAGMEGLKGHRSVGGIRASIYNAVCTESVDALIDFMQTFQKQH